MIQTTIHPTAIVDSKAQLGAGVFVGPFCMIGPDVKVGARSRLESHVVIEGHTSIGEDNVFHAFCVIGGPPQDLSYKGEQTEVLIGDRNVFRESCTVNRATTKEARLTRIGNDNFFMAYVHVAHDCDIGNQNILVNGVNMAGHVKISNQAVISGMSAITQHCRIGDNAFIAAATVVRKDLPPFMVAKEFSEVSGPNLVGLKRRGFNDDEIRIIRDLYKIMYLGNLTTEKAVAEINEKYNEVPVAKRFVHFIQDTKVGIQR